MTARTHTPDRVTVDVDGRKTTTVTVKQACNGCGQYLGDATDAEIWRAVDGLPAEDVRAECAHCAPLVELEAAGCETWHLTYRSYSEVDHHIDQAGVFSKGYTRYVDGRLKLVGLRIGEKPGHVVAFFGDWIVRHPEGTWSVHKAPVAAGTEATA